MCYNILWKGGQYMLKGIKIRIYPDKEQEELLLSYCKDYHNMKNFLVAKFKDNLPNVGNNNIIGYKDQDLLQDYESEYNCQTELLMRSVRGAIVDYVSGVKRFYQKLSSRPPKFHKYDPNKQSFYIIDCKYLIKNFVIQVPMRKELGQKYKSTISKKIPINKKYAIKENITYLKDIRFKYEKGKWYISGCYDVPNVDIDEEKEFLGLDWGIKNFMTTSESTLINYPKEIVREYYRIRKLSHYLDKKVKNSNNYKRLKKKFDKAYKRMNGLKKNFIHQETTKLARKYHIVIEDISWNQISKGKKRKFIRRMSVLAPKYMFEEQLEWKCKKFGSYFIKVNPKNTSKTCSVCGQIHDMTLNDRMMICSCGNKMDRDINAAINIKNAGMNKILAEGICCTR